MGGKQDRVTVCRNAFHQKLLKDLPGKRIKAGNRIIKKKQFRSFGKSEDQRSLGLLTTRKRSTGTPKRNAKVCEPCSGKGIIPLGIRGAPKHEHIFNRERPIQGMLLSNEAQARQDKVRLGHRRSAENLNAATIGAKEPDSKMQEGGLACSIGTNKANHLVCWDIQCTILQCPGLPVALAKTDGFNGGSHALSSVFP